MVEKRSVFAGHHGTAAAEWPRWWDGMAAGRPCVVTSGDLTGVRWPVRASSSTGISVHHFRSRIAAVAQVIVLLIAPLTIEAQAGGEEEAARRAWNAARALALAGRVDSALANYHRAAASAEQAGDTDDREALERTRVRVASAAEQ